MLYRPYSHRKTPTNAGLTLLELLLACALTLMLRAGIYAIFRMGVSSWHKVDSQTELQQSLEVAATRIAKQVQRSPYDSCTISPDGRALACLSALYDDGRVAVSPLDGTLQWQRYLVFYFDSSKGELREVEVPVLASSPERTRAGPLENFDSGSGPQPWPFYTQMGRVLARQVTNFEAVLEPDPSKLLTVTLVGQKKRYGSDAPEIATTRVSIGLRN